MSGQFRTCRACGEVVADGTAYELHRLAHTLDAGRPGRAPPYEGALFLIAFQLGLLDLLLFLLLLGGHL